MKFAGVIVFFVLLCLPALQTFTGWAPPYTIDENRRLAPPPSLQDFRDPVKGAQSLEKYFDDHYGLRDVLIRLKTQLDFSLFHFSDRVHLGHEGWLFYRSVLDTEKPATERFIEGNHDRLTAGVQSLGAALKARGQTLVLMPVFLGDVYYPEMLPNDAPNLPKSSAIAQVTEQWKHVPGVIYVDANTVLEALKQQRQIFHKTDFHWNSPAAFEVGREFVNQLGRDSGIQGPVWDHVLKIEHRRYVGRESDFLPLFRQPSEIGLFVKPTWDQQAVSMETQHGIFEYVSSKVHPDAKTLPPLCLIGDSFFDALLEAGYTSYFRKVYRVRWQGEDTLPSALAQFPPECKYVMLEFIEIQSPALHGLLNGAENLKASLPQSSN
ncbi:hypothetical protein PQQ73_11000 [Paraburkholderia strydomiana]|jgi:hypothetical protein|uniref:AlgX/AlgJ SGNH hydrolase-like domain-containing protein n=1 Tax=Paraburkholderia strydomiana TaxID=1245417 RepID=A0ABW9ECT7_9BURK